MAWGVTSGLRVVGSVWGLELSPVTWFWLKGPARLRPKRTFEVPRSEPQLHRAGQGVILFRPLLPTNPHDSPKCSISIPLDYPSRSVSCSGGGGGIVLLLTDGFDTWMGEASRRRQMKRRWRKPARCGLGETPLLTPGPQPC